VARLTNAELQQRLSDLEAANAELQLEKDAVERKLKASGVRRKRAWGWTLLAAIVIVLGSLLAPIAVVASWAAVELSDTDRFVSTFGPLSQEPAIQDFITSSTVQAIDEKVNLNDLTANVIDGVIALGTGPRATQALQALKGPAAAGMQSLLSNAVLQFVQSDSFATVWDNSLRVSHRAIVSVLDNDNRELVAVGSDGTIGIQLAPIIAQVKTVLIAQGLTFASLIPEINKTIVIAQVDALPAMQVGYRFLTVLGFVLPWVSLLLLAAGVLVARRRVVALIWASSALAFSMTILGVSFGIGKYFVIVSIPASVAPSAATSVVFEILVSAMRQTTVAVAVISVVVAAIAWIAGPFVSSKRLRGLASSGFASMRSAAEKQGVTTGRTGHWTYAHRLLLRIAVAVIAAMVILFVHPLTVTLVVWTLGFALLAIIVLELVARPTDTAAEVDAASIAPSETETLEPVG